MTSVQIKCDFVRTMNPTEKLIELIKPHPCLYNRRDKDYKNTVKKDDLWEKISKALHQSTDETKNKWKNLKDCYTKHRKQIKGTSTTSLKRKYVHWPWAPYFSFIDGVLPCRPTSDIVKPDTSNSSQSSEDLIDATSDMPAPTETLPCPETQCTPFSETPNTQFPGTLPTHTSVTLQTPSTIPSASKKVKTPEDEMDKVLNYLKHKKRGDAVDLLFNSYAESFKKLKPSTQADVKLKLAHIFNEAELNDLDSVNQNAR